MLVHGCIDIHYKFHKFDFSLYSLLLYRIIWKQPRKENSHDYRRLKLLFFTHCSLIHSHVVIYPVKGTNHGTLAKVIKTQVALLANAQCSLNVKSFNTFIILCAHHVLRAGCCYKICRGSYTNSTAKKKRSKKKKKQ